MPRRGGVKVKKIMPKGSPDDANVLNDMFSQMTGAENADPEIIIPKLCKLYTLLNKYSKIYQMLLKFNEFIDKFPEHENDFLDIRKFIENIAKISDSGNSITEESLKNSTSDNVNTMYKKLKDTAEVQSIIVISGELDKYKKYLSDKNNLGDEFIKREPGLSLKPLTFTNLDLKILWASNKLSIMAKKYILNILSHTYLIGHEMYQTITSPDVDIKKFSRVLINNIDKMKKQIPRCNKAFDIIANSVNMLENKFDGYYKTSVEAENPSIIIESFIIDVSMSQKANASITSQFRKIIMYMKKQTAQSKDPRVSKLFKILNSQFNLMQKETGVEPDSDEETDNKKPTPEHTESSKEDLESDNNMNEMTNAMESLIGSISESKETSEDESDNISYVKETETPPLIENPINEIGMEIVD
jgi:hypothetical protein